MEGSELRSRLDRLGRSYTEIAPLLGLSLSGLHKQMNGQNPVSRQTEIILTMLESLPKLNQEGRMMAMRQMEQMRKPKRRS